MRLLCFPARMFAADENLSWNSSSQVFTQKELIVDISSCVIQKTISIELRNRATTENQMIFSCFGFGVSKFRLSQQFSSLKCCLFFCFPPLSFQSALFLNHHVNGFFSPLSQYKYSQLKGLRLLNIARPRQREDLLS